MSVALVLGAGRVGVALALLGAPPDAGAGHDGGRAASVCVERSESRPSGDPKVPVHFSLSSRTSTWRVEGDLHDPERLCFEAPPGRMQLEYELSSTDPSKPGRCRVTMGQGLSLGAVNRLVVGLGKHQTCAGVDVDSHDEPKPSDSAGQVAKKDFVTLLPVSSYSAARRLAHQVAARLGIRLDLGESRPHGKGELTFSKATCDANEWSYPCYIARGRDDDGVYVSIDVASAYPGVQGPGYVVVLASGPKDDPSVRAAFEKARSSFPETSIQTNDVYMGCIH
jgi:hypothetical protein